MELALHRMTFSSAQLTQVTCLCLEIFPTLNKLLLHLHTNYESTSNHQFELISTSLQLTTKYINFSELPALDTLRSAANECC